MVGRLRTVVSKAAAVTAAAIVAALSTIRVAYAASTDASLSPEYAELLRLAQEKVAAATQPGALGNGIPVINDIMSVLPWMGLAAAISIGAVVAAKVLVPRMRSEVLIAQ